MNTINTIPSALPSVPSSSNAPLHDLPMAERQRMHDEAGRFAEHLGASAAAAADRKSGGRPCSPKEELDDTELLAGGACAFPVWPPMTHGHGSVDADLDLGMRASDATDGSGAGTVETVGTMPTGDAADESGAATVGTVPTVATAKPLPSLAGPRHAAAEAASGAPPCASSLAPTSLATQAAENRLTATVAEFSAQLGHLERHGNIWASQAQFVIRSSTLAGATMHLSGSLQRLDITIVPPAGDVAVWLQNNRRRLSDELARRLHRSIEIQVAGPADAHGGIVRSAHFDADS